MRHRDVVLRTAQVSALPDHLARGEVQRLEAYYVPDEDQPLVDERLEVHPHVQRVSDLLAPEPLAAKGFEREYLPGHRSEDHDTGRVVARWHIRRRVRRPGPHRRGDARPPRL